jgi:hypothetical protein
MTIACDRTLEMTTLILPSIPVNIRDKEMTDHESNGVSYLKIPVSALPRAQSFAGRGRISRHSHVALGKPCRIGVLAL